MYRCEIVCMSSERVDKVQKSLGRCPPETRNQISTGNRAACGGEAHGLDRHESLCTYVDVERRCILDVQEPVYAQ